MSKVLIIEDSATTRAVIKVYLMGHRLEFFEATNGMDGLQLARKERPAVIVLDLKMPVLDGLALFEELKKLHPPLPVLFVTGHRGAFDLSSERVHSLWHAHFGEGNVDILYKPFTEVALFEKVEMLIGPP